MSAARPVLIASQRARCLDYGGRSCCLAALGLASALGRCLAAICLAGLVARPAAGAVRDIKTSKWSSSRRPPPKKVRWSRCVRRIQRIPHRVRNHSEKTGPRRSAARSVRDYAVLSAITWSARFAHGRWWPTGRRRWSSPCSSLRFPCRSRHGCRDRRDSDKTSPLDLPTVFGADLVSVIPLGYWRGHHAGSLLASSGDSAGFEGRGPRRALRRVAFCRSELATADWSPNWLGYTAYDVVLMTAQEAAVAACRGLLALRRYVEAGGIVLVQGDPPILRKLIPAAAARGRPSGTQWPTPTALSTSASGWWAAVPDRELLAGRILGPDSQRRSRLRWTATSRSSPK